MSDCTLQILDSGQQARYHVYKYQGALVVQAVFPILWCNNITTITVFVVFKTLLQMVGLWTKDTMTVLGEWNVVKNYVVSIKMYKPTTYFLVCTSGADRLKLYSILYNSK